MTIDFPGADSHSLRVKTRAPRRLHAFSLIEIMIAIVIVGVLAALAYPTYLQHVRESRRTDAMDTLLALQQAQVKWRARHGAYTASLTDLGWVPGNSDSREGYYAVQIAVATSYAFTATATPKPGGLQAADTCGFSVNPDGPVIATDADRQCWRKR